VQKVKHAGIYILSGLAKLFIFSSRFDQKQHMDDMEKSHWKSYKKHRKLLPNLNAIF
jgi:hypothetical protein